MVPCGTVPVYGVDPIIPEPIRQDPDASAHLVDHWNAWKECAACFRLKLRSIAKRGDTLDKKPPRAGDSALAS